MSNLSCSLIHSVNKNLTEHNDKIDDATKTEVTAAIDEAKAVASDASLETLKERVTALSNASMKIGQAIYGKKGDAPAEGEAASSSSAESDAKDAEYEEKKK